VRKFDRDWTINRFYSSRCGETFARFTEKKLNAVPPSSIEELFMMHWMNVTPLNDDWRKSGRLLVYDSGTRRGVLMNVKSRGIASNS